MSVLDSLDTKIPDPENVPYRDLALRTGGWVALATILLGLVFYVTGLNETMMRSTAGQWVNSLAMFGITFYFVFTALKNHRRNDLGGYLGIGRGVGFGTLTGLISGLLSAVWTYLFMTFIAPEMSEQIKQITIENLQKQGMDDDQIEGAMKMASMFMTPAAMGISRAIMNVFFGLIIGAISGMILKKERSLS